MAVKVTNMMSVTFNPYAECMGVDDRIPCPEAWEHQESPRSRDEAKLHAQHNVGHRVRVVVEKVDLYIGAEK